MSEKALKNIRKSSEKHQKNIRKSSEKYQKVIVPRPRYACTSVGVRMYFGRGQGRRTKITRIKTATFSIVRH